jgi:hypothetical protein
MIRIETTGDSLSFPSDKQNGPSGLQPAEADASNFGAFMMQNNGTATIDRPEAAQVSPLIAGPEWFDAEPDSWTVRMHVPLTPEQMTAAVFFAADYWDADDDLSAVDVWGGIACIVAAHGLCELGRMTARVAEIVASPEPGDLELIAAARARVAAVTGAPVPTVPRLYSKVARGRWRA